ncbi:YtxH domain-containing protein [Patiriisocius sp. Uisw_017]|jgi:gas vesicle protein|uniref:YtxH domain-containing protein n=1 Tax=Patiriisocius sp. Uisw_017 TaxID=3230968 RepID=UPI0039E832D0
MASNTGTTLLAILTGAAIGAGIGILYAPDSGAKTREKIAKETKKAEKKFKKQLKEAEEILGSNAESAKLTFEESLENTLSSASYKAEDILAALESKLRTLRAQNAKLQKEVKVEEQKTPATKATS